MENNLRNTLDSRLAKILLEKRHEKRLNLLQLANLSQLQTTVINDAERGKSSPTLLTVATLSYYLDFDVKDFLDQFDEIDVEDFLHQYDHHHNLLGPDRETSLSDSVLRIQDIELFLEYSGDDPSLGIKELSQYYAIVIAVNHPEISTSKEILQLSEEWVAVSLNPPAIPPTKRPDHYPENIESLELKRIFNNSGVLLLSDCGYYLRVIRKQSNITGLVLQSMTSVSDSTISRLETGEITRIRFADIVSIDTALGASGQIIAMFWRAALLHTGLIRNKYYDIPKKYGPLAWTQSEWPVVETLVKMDRQMRSVIHNNGSWVFDFRQTLGNWKQSHPSPAGDAGLPKHILWRLDPRDHLAEIIFKRLKTNRFDLMRPATFIDNYERRIDIEIWNQFVNLYRNNPEALMIMEKGAHYSATPEEEDAFLKLIIEVLQQDTERRRNLEKMLI